MIYITLILLITPIIPIILLLINLMISSKTHKLNEKTTPYECGFMPLNKSYTPFSNSFFIITMMFLIFDIEISLMLPIINIMKNIAPNMILSIMIFIMFMILSLLMEWSMKNLIWLI